VSFACLLPPASLRQARAARAAGGPHSGLSSPRHRSGPAPLALEAALIRQWASPPLCVAQSGGTTERLLRTPFAPVCVSAAAALGLEDGGCRAIGAVQVSDRRLGACGVLISPGLGDQGSGREKWDGRGPSWGGSPGQAQRDPQRSAAFQRVTPGVAEEKNGGIKIAPEVGVPPVGRAVGSISSG